ncbi:MAG: TIGR04282 family arsenosugar biosynthesis glycosyltransferase [Pseudomonadota bacterium]
MVKEPRPGQVKTRLARDIGAVEAAWWYRHHCAKLLRAAPRYGWQTELAVTADVAGRASRVWPPHFPRRAQGRGDLGARMARLLCSGAPGPVVVIGSDIPGITRSLIADAFHALGSHDAVIGPAVDGGYWLIGLARRRAPPPGLFFGVRWSTHHALEDTCATLGDNRLATIQSLRDVDSIDDLRAIARL